MNKPSHNLVNYVGDEIQNNEMGGACGVYGD
jgi:hypothetical protein